MMNEKTPQSKNHKRRHIAYLLRLWRVGEPESSDWQASLEVPGTGKRIGFANLEQLFAFLMELSEEDQGVQGAEKEK